MGQAQTPFYQQESDHEEYCQQKGVKCFWKAFLKKMIAIALKTYINMLSRNCALLFVLATMLLLIANFHKGCFASNLSFKLVFLLSLYHIEFFLKMLINGFKIFRMRQLFRCCRLFYHLFFPNMFCKIEIEHHMVKRYKIENFTANITWRVSTLLHEESTNTDRWPLHQHVDYQDIKCLF